MFKFVRNKLKRNKGRASKEERIAKFQPNSHSHLRANSKRVRKRELLRRPSLKIPKFKIPNRRIFPFLALALILMIIAGGVLIILKSDIFLVKNVFIATDGEEFESEVRNDFLGKNIFSFDGNSVRNSIKSNFEYVTEVYIRKEYPDTLRIEFVQDKPKYEVFMVKSYEFSEDFRAVSEDAQSINRKLTMNEQGVVLQYDEYLPTIIFSDFDIKVLKGERDLDSDQIRGIYKSQLETEEERESFDWEVVAVEEKERIFNDLAGKTSIKLVEFYESFGEGSSLQRFVQYGGRVSELGFQSDRLGKNQFTIDLMNFLNDKKYEYNIPVWLTPTTLMLDLTDGRRMYFSSGRSFADQLRDLKVIFDNNIINTGRIFDLRTSNFSVSN